jgi:hypothetical protein
MATPTVDKLVRGNLVMHDHSQSDLGAVLDTRYIKRDGSTPITANWNVDGAGTLFVDKTNGRVGIRTTSPSEKLQVDGNVLIKSGRLSVGTTTLNTNYVIEALATETATSGEKRALSFTIYGNPTADWGNTSILGLNGFAEHCANYNALGSHFGGFFGARNSGTSTLWTSYGGFLEVQNTSTGTCSYAVGAVASIKDTGGGNFTNAYGLLTQAEVASGGTIGTFFGTYIKNPTGSGSVTTNYGLYIEDQIKGTTNYSIYSVGGTNYFGGKVGIGETSPDYKLDVNGAIGFTPGSSVTPVDNGDVVIEATNNTTLTFKLKGSDGTIRSGTVTLS